MDSVDIARLVGVARSTVSKALNGYPHIAASTRERILRAVRTYEYYPNYSAQILAGTVGPLSRTLAAQFGTLGQGPGDLEPLGRPGHDRL